MKNKREKKRYEIPAAYAGIPVSDDVRETLIESAEAEAKQKKWAENHGIRKSLSDDHHPHLFHPEPTLCEEYEEKDLIARLLGEIGKLSDYERLLIRKRFYEVQPLESIAMDVGVSVGTIHNRMAEIIEKLSISLKEDL